MAKSEKGFTFHLQTCGEGDEKKRWGKIGALTVVKKILIACLTD
jgi:hypothetical protein